MNLGKVAQIAGREYASTALTKGFIAGVLVLPLILIVVFPVVRYLMENAKPPAVEGRIAIIDRTGLVSDAIEAGLTPEALAAARGDTARESAEELAETASEIEPGQQLSAEEQLDAAGKAGETLSALLAEVPQFTTEVLPADTDPETITQQIRETLDAQGSDKLIGVVTIDANAVVPSDEAGLEFGGFGVVVRPKVDEGAKGSLRRVTRQAILDARYDAGGMDADRIKAITTVDQRATEEVTETGTRESNFGLQILLPAGFMLLILMSVLTGGQYLLTTTIEEKSSRVIELLLSAASTMELMTGKVIGQMLVGLTMLTIYGALAITALLVFVTAGAELIEPGQIAALIVFFVIAYFTVASLMAAIGAAVNELREAQSLMTPIMLTMMIPYFLVIPITQAPSAAFSRVLSFIPPVSPFVMMMRVASIEPPPLWEVLASMAVSAVGALVCVWLAAKIFRVGLLMFGKPPSFGTLIRWIRMA